MHLAVTDLTKTLSLIYLQRIIIYRQSYIFRLAAIQRIKNRRVIIILNIPELIKLFMSQINNSVHYSCADALKLTTKEALIFLEKRQYSYSKQALSACQTFEQIFSYLLGLQKNTPPLNKIDISWKTGLESRINFQQQHKNMVKSKLSTKSTSSEFTNKSAQESTLVQQIQRQQETIEKLKNQLYKTEKMVLITKKLEREAYRNVDDSIDLVLKKESKIQNLKANQQHLLKRIKERDQLLEYTVSIIEKR